MKYEKANAEIIEFGTIIFMTSSYNSAAEALQANCKAYDNGPTNNFHCNDFGGYTPDNVFNGATVNIEGTEYVFTSTGNGNGQHWRCTSV